LIKTPKNFLESLHIKIQPTLCKGSNDLLFAFACHDSVKTRIGLSAWEFLWDNASTFAERMTAAAITFESFDHHHFNHLP
jgi:hypothetical protein